MLLMVAALGLVVSPVLHASCHRMDHVHGALAHVAPRASWPAAALHQHGNGQFHVDLEGLFVPSAPVPGQDAPARRDSERDHAGLSLLHCAAGMTLEAVPMPGPPHCDVLNAGAEVGEQHRPLPAFFLVVRSAQGPPSPV